MKEYLYKLFYELTGYKITSKERIFVERYFDKQVGMSSGYVDPEFWYKKGIPLVLERYDNIKI